MFMRTISKNTLVRKVLAKHRFFFLVKLCQTDEMIDMLVWYVLAVALIQINAFLYMM